MARPETESRREESSWTSGAQSSWEARCRHPQSATGLRGSARETVSSCCLESPLEAERFPGPAKANHGGYHQKQDTRRAQAEPPQRVLEERQVPAEGAIALNPCVRRIGQCDTVLQRLRRRS